MNGYTGPISLFWNFNTRKLLLIKSCKDRFSIYSAFSLVQRMISRILSFLIGSNLLGLKLVSGLGSIGIILVKKSAMKLWYQEEVRQFFTGIRLLLKIQGLILYPYILQYPVSSIQSSFSLIFVHLNLNRAGLGAMLNTNLYTLGFGLTRDRSLTLSLKRICDPRFNMIRALFV